jgi:hypothetical protein
MTPEWVTSRLPAVACAVGADDDRGVRECGFFGRATERASMREAKYAVRGFLTIRKDSMRMPLRGSLALGLDLDSGLFSGDLALEPSVITRTVLGASIFSATVQIAPESPVIGVVGREGRVFATVSVDAVIAAAHAAGRALISGCSCRTSEHAIVPLRSKPGFSFEEGGRLVGSYRRPPFTGCGWATPIVNLLVAGPGNVVVIDLIPVTSGAGCPATPPGP